jgi:hypothetical protein
MALILQRSRFLHTPKTGGMWVNRAVRNSGILCASIDRELEHINLFNCPGSGLFTMAFVREPWSWWRSYWVFKQGHGWDESIPLDRDCRADRFERFMLRVLEFHPGYCSDVFELYTGCPGHEIQFIGRSESIVEDLIRGLALAGEDFDESAIRATPALNVGDYKAHAARCSPEVRALVIESESRAVERFGYRRRG